MRSGRFKSGKGEGVGNLGEEEVAHKRRGMGLLRESDGEWERSEGKGVGWMDVETWRLIRMGELWG